MNIFLSVRFRKTTIFLDLPETSPLVELKKMLEGILKKKPEDIKCYKMENGQIKDGMEEEEKSLSDYGYTADSAKAQAPAEIAVTFRKADGNFDDPLITPYSSPPPLPDVMKPNADSGGQATPKLQPSDASVKPEA